MSSYRELVQVLNELLNNRFYPKKPVIRGLLGDGQGNVIVPGREDFSYVRFNRSSSEKFEIFNKEVSQPIDGWPVLIGEKIEQPGLIQVISTDWAAYSQTGWGDSVASIQAHAPTHEWPTFAPGSDAVNVYMRALTPLRTQVAGSGSNSVYVTPYEYDHTGTNVQWPGVPAMDFSAKPPTGSMLYMGVYLNPATNALGVVSGSTTVFTDAIEPSIPNWPLGVYPSGYVRLYGGQAGITERDIRPAQRIYNTTLMFTGTSAGGGAAHNLLSTTHPDTLPASVQAGDLVYGNATPLWARLGISVTGSFLGNIGGLPGYRYIVPTDINSMQGGIWRYRPDGLRIKEATIALAQTNGANDDEVHLYPGTYDLGAGLTVSKRLHFVGEGDPRSIIITGSGNFTLEPTIAACTFRNLTILNTAGGGTDRTIIQSNVNNCVYENCILTKTGAADDSACILQYGGTGTQVINCELTTTGATKNYAIWNNTAVVTIEIIDGSLSGTTQDILSDQASTFTMRGVKLVNALISLTGSGILVGYYVNAAGNVVLVGSSILAGVDKYIISATVATDDLTVALKTLAGADPSAASPVFVKIGDVVRPITAALSVTANDGTNWFSSGAATTATLDVDYFVYAIQETGASAGTKIGFARIPYAVTMANFVNTTTSQFYIKGNWTNFNATDQVTLIGRFNAILSATAAFTWSLTTAVIINRPIFETRRLAFTSAITSQTGTITTVGTVVSSYIVAGRYFYMWQSIGITTNGTGATAVLSTIPLTPGGILTVMPGREVLVSGKMLQGYVQATTTATWVNYDNTYPAASGANLACGGVAIPLV